MADNPKDDPPLTGAEAGRAAAQKKTKLPPPKKLPTPNEQSRPQSQKIVTDGVDG